MSVWPFDPLRMFSYDLVELDPPWHFDPKALAAAYLLMKSSRLHETMSFGSNAVPDVISNLKEALSGLEGLFAHEGFAEIRAEIAARLPATEPVKRRSLR